MKNPVSFVASFMPQQVFDPSAVRMVSGGLETTGSLSVKVEDKNYVRTNLSQIHPEDVLKFSAYLNRPMIVTADLWKFRRMEREHYSQIVRRIGAELTFGSCLDDLLAIWTAHIHIEDTRAIKAAYHQFKTLVAANSPDQLSALNYDIVNDIFAGSGYIQSSPDELVATVLKQVNRFRQRLFQNVESSYKALTTENTPIFETKTSEDYASITAPRH